MTSPKPTSHPHWTEPPAVREQNHKPDGNLLIDRADEAAEPIRVLLEGETVWPTQKMLAGLCQVGVNTINDPISGSPANARCAPSARTG